ncbi:uncharacterized protein FA14DRAFT_184004 [Meira miltonrushii]|uniref:Uncharacterized protein n=1 Tax=Meira miltonrushii TaxID=1280837 RepID=A0A316V172_9BASI|nr:uncharacterized protein FA14DRAFT_184004 [Meira miltonrushii]PWN31300.1 hypothetical protein FA14DRAFT_184004 [Meira miltonrushii]
MRLSSAVKVFKKNDSDDTVLDVVVDEVYENEADDAKDDRAGTNPISKIFAVQRHYEPLLVGPERHFESRKLQFETRIVPGNRQSQGEAIIDIIRLATRKLHPDCQIEYIPFKYLRLHKPSTMLTEAEYRALNAFARLWNSY